MSAIGRADSHATGRQRREGRRPLGNSKGTKVSSSSMPGAQTHWAAQVANGPPGTVPGAVRSAYTPCSVANTTKL